MTLFITPDDNTILACGYRQLNNKAIKCRQLMKMCKYFIVVVVIIIRYGTGDGHSPPPRRSSPNISPACFRRRRTFPRSMFGKVMLETRCPTSLRHGVYRVAPTRRAAKLINRPLMASRQCMAVYAGWRHKKDPCKSISCKASSRPLSN